MQALVNYFLGDKAKSWDAAVQWIHSAPERHPALMCQSPHSAGPRRARGPQAGPRVRGVPAPLFTDASVGSTTSLARVLVGREDTCPYPLPKPPVRPAAPPPTTRPSSPSSLGPCSLSASPLGDQGTCNPLLRAGPPAGAGVRTQAPHSRRAPESSGARGYTGRTTDPLGSWLGEKKENHLGGYFWPG